MQMLTIKDGPSKQDLLQNGFVNAYRINGIRHEQIVNPEVHPFFIMEVPGLSQNYRAHFMVDQIAHEDGSGQSFILSGSILISGMRYRFKDAYYFAGPSRHGTIRIDLP